MREDRATSPAAPSATVASLREGERGPEVLLLRRHSSLGFHGGDWVFPGGRVDASDHPHDDPHSMRAGIYAAVREAWEEADLILRPDALQPISHWTTPTTFGKRFATWFFVAEVPARADVVVDRGEITQHRWMRPREALRAFEKGAIGLPPPTFVTLHWLLGAQSVAEALRSLETTSPPRYLPRYVEVPRGRLSVLDDDAAYEDGRLDRPGERHRIWQLDSGWSYERRRI